MRNARRKTLSEVKKKPPSTHSTAEKKNKRNRMQYKTKQMKVVATLNHVAEKRATKKNVENEEDLFEYE